MLPGVSDSGRPGNGYDQRCMKIQSNLAEGGIVVCIVQYDL